MNKYIFGIFILAIISIAFNLKQCQDHSDLEKINNQIHFSLRDSLRVMKDKENNLEYAKASYLLDKKKLEELNKDLYDELNRNKEKVVTLSGIVVEYKKNYDRLETELNSLVTYLSDEDKEKYEYDKKYQTIKVDWSYAKQEKDLYRFTSGYSLFQTNSADTITIKNLRSFLEKDVVKFKLYTGVRWNSEQEGYEAYVKSLNKDLTFEIESAIEKENFFPKNKESSVSIGFHIGVGGAIPTNFNQGLFPSINFGIGINYSIIKF